MFIFLPFTATGFFMLSRYPSVQTAIAWLVGASLFFYGCWNPAFLGLIGLSIVFNYFIGKYLAQIELRYMLVSYLKRQKLKIP